MNNFITLFLGGLLGFIPGFALSIPDIKKLVRIHRTPAYSIDMIPDGKIVALTGKVLPESRSILSPLTQTTCVLWHAEVLESIHSGEVSRWETIFNETSIHPFDIQSNTGILKVYPENAEVILRKDFYEVGVTFKPALQAVIEKLQTPTRDPFEQTEPFQVHEQVVKAGETIYVLGRIKEKNGIQTISSSNDGSPFLISDRSQRALFGTFYWRVIARVFLLTSWGVLITLLVLSHK
jgi:hypothetical protein